MVDAMHDATGKFRIGTPREPLDDGVMKRVQDGLQQCPDVAFAHLPEVMVPGRQERPGLVLFVWLVPGALRSLRSALNLVSEVVARALPEERYLDVVILNSAPELLEAVERAQCLVVERDPEERQRALNAAAGSAGDFGGPRRRRWWWPFG